MFTGKEISVRNDPQVTHSKGRITQKFYRVHIKTRKLFSKNFKTQSIIVTTTGFNKTFRILGIMSKFLKHINIYVWISISIWSSMNMKKIWKFWYHSVVKFHLVTKLRERYGVVRDFIFRHDDALLHIHERKSEHQQQLTLA